MVVTVKGGANGLNHVVIQLLALLLAAAHSLSHLLRRNPVEPLELLQKLIRIQAVHQVRRDDARSRPQRIYQPENTATHY